VYISGLIFSVISIDYEPEFAGNLQDTIATVNNLTRGRSFIRIIFKRQKQPAIPPNVHQSARNLLNSFRKWKKNGNESIARTAVRIIGLRIRTGFEKTQA
jgi:hypothetical protein